MLSWCRLHLFFSGATPTLSWHLILMFLQNDLVLWLKPSWITLLIPLCPSDLFLTLFWKRRHMLAIYYVFWHGWTISFFFGSSAWWGYVCPPTGKIILPRPRRSCWHRWRFSLFRGHTHLLYTNAIRKLTKGGSFRYLTPLVIMTTLMQYREYFCYT